MSSDHLKTDWQQLHKGAFKNVRVLITGGAGFIGSHLAEALVSLGAEVVVLDDLSGGDVKNLKGISPINFVKGTVLDQPTVDSCVRGCQYIFHQAALGSVPGSVDDPRRYHAANDIGTLNVLEAARAAGVKRVMFAASSAAYGENPVPWIETQPIMAKSPYAANKIAGEAMLGAWAGSYGMDTCSLRYFNIFGSRQNANSAYAAVIAAFAKAVIQGKRPIIYGDGTQTRDFTFVHNVVHANLLAARHPGPIGGLVINVGCGVAVDVNELARLVGDALSRPDLKPEHRPERAGDLKHSYADLTRARAVLGYSPIVSFEPGLRHTLAWYRNELSAA